MQKETCGCKFAESVKISEQTASIHGNGCNGCRVGFLYSQKTRLAEEWNEGKGEGGEEETKKIQNNRSVSPYQEDHVDYGAPTRKCAS